MQNRTDAFIRNTEFKRVMREIREEITKDLHWQLKAFEELQAVTEAYLTETIELENYFSKHLQRVPIRLMNVFLDRKFKEQ